MDTNHNDKTRIRVVDANGHLLCFWNPQTRNIEIKGINRGTKSPGGGVYCVNIDVLIHLGASNIISNNPVFVLEAKPINVTEK